MMRKTLTLFLSMALALSLFTGCYTFRTTEDGFQIIDSDTISGSQSSGNKSTKESVPWDGTVATSYESGSGTSEDPYEIASAEQLALLAQQTNEGKVYSGMCYYLSNDIYLNSSSDVENITELIALAYKECVKDSENIVATIEELSMSIIEYLTDIENYNFNEWTPIGTRESPFKGIFNGNGYTIYRMYSPQGNLYDYYGSYSCYNGLFGCMDSGTISDVKVDSAIIVGPSYISGEYCHTDCGGIVGWADNGTIEKCSVNYIWAESGNSAGGIAGSTSGDEDDYIEINNCVTHSNCCMITMYGRSGGIISDGEKYCRIMHCFSYGYADCGIVGNSDVRKISYCMSLGDSDDYAIIGGTTNAEASISSCYFSNTSAVDGCNRTFSGILATSESNLRSFDWLVDNLGISDSIWYMSDGELYLK